MASSRQHRWATLPRPRRGGLLAVLALALLASLRSVEATDTDASPRSPQLSALAAAPRGLFLENKGQVAEPVAFYLPGARGTVFITPTEIVFSLGQPMMSADEALDRPLRPMDHAVIRQKFVQGSSKVSIEGLDRAEANTNVIRGGAAGATSYEGIASFHGVRLRSLYRDIDLECRVNASGIERTIVLHDDAKLDAVTFRYEGIDSLRLTDDGQLELVTNLGLIREAPIQVRFENTPNTPVVTASYRVTAPKTVALELKHG